MATASLSTSWTLSNGSTRAEWFTDGSFLLPILHTETYGFGFYGMEAQISGEYFLAVFILPCYDYGLTSTPAAGCTPQLVWSPIRKSAVKMNSTLELESGGDLVLKDADRTVVWSTNTSGKSVASMNLTGLGNLVLIDKNNVSVWESFDHPTDSLLVGQKLAPEGLFGLVLTDPLHVQRIALARLPSSTLQLTIIRNAPYIFINQKKKSANEAEDEDYLDQVPRMPPISKPSAARLRRQPPPSGLVWSERRARKRSLAP
ncbi:hypothetical protein CDL15_Pgr002914 [Punica granatum]|uniref:Bulb-type lectin domain-containing protein n=1 Tax=Punica granatum TaxID=22663 RepID=A0A218X1C3_PUNGR|nr:hypothetical protein CDL15_Pgr002914 [Punica granatum]